MACLAWFRVLSAASRTLCDRSDCPLLDGPEDSVGGLAIVALLDCLIACSRWTQVLWTSLSRGLTLFAVEGLAVDRVSVPVGDLARVVHQKPRLLHRILGQARQVVLRHAYLRQGGRDLAVPADGRERFDKALRPLGGGQTLRLRIEDGREFGIERLRLGQVEAQDAHEYER